MYKIGILAGSYSEYDGFRRSNRKVCKDNYTYLARTPDIWSNLRGVDIIYCIGKWKSMDLGILQEIFYMARCHNIKIESRNLDTDLEVYLRIQEVDLHANCIKHFLAKLFIANTPLHEFVLSQCTYNKETKTIIYEGQFYTTIPPIMDKLIAPLWLMLKTSSKGLDVVFSRITQHQEAHEYVNKGRDLIPFTREITEVPIGEIQALRTEQDRLDALITINFPISFKPPKTNIPFSRVNYAAYYI